MAVEAQVRILVKANCLDLCEYVLFRRKANSLVCLGKFAQTHCFFCFEMRVNCLPILNEISLNRIIIIKGMKNNKRHRFHNNTKEIGTD